MFRMVRSRRFLFLLLLGFLGSAGALKGRQMLPDITLDSGQIAELSIEYAPAAAEIVTPMEGNLALAVRYVSSGVFPEWFPPVFAAGVPAPGVWGVSSTVTGITIEPRRVVVPSTPGAHTVWLMASLPDDLDEFEVYLYVSGEILPTINGFVEDAAEHQSEYVTVEGTSYGGTFSINTLGVGRTAFITINWTGTGAVTLGPPTPFEINPVTLSAVMRPGQILGTRGAREDNTIFTGLLPDGITLFPLDPARYGHGTAGQRVGLLEFTGTGVADMRAAIVRWRDPS